jgi:hypothetical protein
MIKNEISKPFSNHIFIVGVGRSGTSLLQSMLNAHPDIAFIPEINYIRRFLFTNKLKRAGQSGSASAVVELLNNDTKLRRLYEDYHFLLKDIGKDMLSLEKHIYLDILEKYRIEEKKTFIGDKDPRAVELLSKIREMFSGALIINMVRDPRDVLVSKMKADWSKDRPYIIHILINNFQMAISRQHEKTLDDRYLNLVYEHLIADPQPALVPIFQKLGIEFDDRIFEFRRSSKKLVHSSEMQWKKNTLGPLLKNNSDKWKSSLSRFQVFLVESIVYHAFTHYGYQKTIRNTSIFSKAMAFSLKVASMMLTKTFLSFRKYV